MKRNCKNLSYARIIIVVLCLVASSEALAARIYVDRDASGANDGSSWDNAYNYLQDALAAASSGDEVWVVAGIYKPDQGAAVTPSDREATFQLKNGVAIYGGFAGGETSRDQQDTVTNVTILSGDLNSNDTEVADPWDLLTEPTRAENSYHVVTGSGTDATAVLDGFTVTAGNANGSPPHDEGGGLFNDGSPTLTNCTFTANSAAGGGGMANNFNAGSTLTKCTFNGNSAGSGGGVLNNGTGLTLTNCTFSSNWANYGGGMCNYLSNSSMLTNCTFSSNWANYGGGMCNWSTSPTVTDCTFSGNSANSGYGGGMYNSESSATLTNCTFSNNRANYGYGGGMYNVSSSPTVTDCTFSGNSTDRGGGMANFDSSSPVVTNCTFSGNMAEYYAGGGGMCNSSSSSPTVINCTFSGNDARRGGGMSNWPSSSPTVTNCKFYDNTAGYGGGGMYNRDSSSPTVTNCTFSGNSTLEDGGGMYNLGSSPTLTNCTFSGNDAGTAPGFSGHGGGMFNWSSSSSPTVTNCTFTQNSAGAPEDGGGGMYNLSSCSPTVTNCIFWSNLPSEIRNNNAYASLTYCDVLGGYAGEANINTDPLFVDADGPDDTVGTADDNLRLLAGSLCIDAGDNTAVPPDANDLDGDGDTTEPIPWDLDRNPRIIGDEVDMGAYEFQGNGIVGDFCGEGSDQPDGYVDYWDLLYFAQRWHSSPSDNNWDSRCDLDKEDDYVDYWDLLVFAQQWHKGQKP